MKRRESKAILFLEHVADKNLKNCDFFISCFSSEEWLQRLSDYLYKSACLSVIESACLFVDDSPWDKEGFRLKKNIRIRRTVSRKIACIVLSYFALKSAFFPVWVFNR